MTPGLVINAVASPACLEDVRVLSATLGTACLFGYSQRSSPGGLITWSTQKRS